MKAFYRLSVCAALIVSALTALVGCRAPQDDLQSGIVITEEAGYSELTLSRAREVINSLILSYLRQSSGVELPPSTSEKVWEVSEELSSVISEVPLAEEQFVQLLELLEEYGKGAVSELTDDGDGTENIQALYLGFCSVSGQDYVGKVLYRILEYSLDYHHTKRMDEYQKYGFTYLLDEADVIAKEKAVLSSDVGEDNFVRFIRGAVSFSELWLGGGFDAEQAMSFSDEEVLVFLSEIDFSLKLSDDGWRVLLSRVAPMVASEVGREAWEIALENRDVDRLSSVMNYLTELISSVQSSLTVDEIKALREGEREELIAKIFGLFGDGEWELFSEITSVGISGGDYDRLFSEKYGDDYLRYKETLSAVTLEELKGSVGKENFYESLERYVGGISPAFAYGMRR